MALWGIPLILTLSYFGSFYFLLLVVIINLMALWEFYTMFREQEVYAFRWLGIFLSVIFLVAAYWLSLPQVILLLFALTAGVLLRHLKIDSKMASMNTVFTLGGIFYISFFLLSLLELRLNFNDFVGKGAHSNVGGKFLVLLWISIWVCDTFAYFGGKMFGKHKLAPNTSPNKTVEGAIWGIIGALLIFVGVGKLYLSFLPDWQLITSALIVGVFGQFGDLVESRFKRDAGVKDTSTMLPGHGGFLDRFDSIIFVSPFFFLLFYLA